MLPPDCESTDWIAALPERAEFADRPQSAEIAKLPGCAAVYLFVDAAGAPVQLATTQHLRRLATSRLLDETRLERGKADLAEIVRGVRWRPIAHPFEGRFWYFRLARNLYPRDYRKRIAFGPAWFLHLPPASAAPEIQLTDAVWRDPGEFVGPFPSRAAGQNALEGLWDLFDLCRYPEQVRRAPHGRRCAYADMGRCDAPCDGSTPTDPMRARVHAAWQFAAGEIDPWIRTAREQMQSAAAGQQFELAGQLKRRIEFAERWRADWSAQARRAKQLELLFLLPVTRRRAWRIMLFAQGELVEGPIAATSKAGATAVEFVSTAVGSARTRAADCEALLRCEQTWLFAHLLFSRDSESALFVSLTDCLLDETLAARIQAELATLRPPRATPTPESDE